MISMHCTAILLKIVFLQVFRQSETFHWVRYSSWFSTRRRARNCVFRGKILIDRKNRIFPETSMQPSSKSFFRKLFRESLTFSIDGYWSYFVMKKRVRILVIQWKILIVGKIISFFFLRFQSSHVRNLFFVEFFLNFRLFMEFEIVPDSTWRDESAAVSFNENW